MNTILKILYLPLLFRLHLSAGPKPCLELKVNFPDLRCPQEGFSEWKMTLDQKMHIIPLFSAPTAQIKSFTLVARDVGDPKTKEDTYRGIKIMKSFKYQTTIPTIIKTVEDDGWIYQLIDASNISIISAGKMYVTLNHLSEQGIKPRFASLLSGLKAIHSAGYVYNNVFSYSYLMNLDDWAFPTRFIDFSLAAKIGDPIDDRGDFRYWEPTRLAGNEKTFTKNADLYSFGILLYEITHKGKFPFEGKTKEEYTTNVLAGDYQIDEEVFPEMAALIGMMLQQDADRRLNFGDLAVAIDGLDHLEKVHSMGRPITLSNKKELPKELLDQLSPELKLIMFPQKSAYLSVKRSSSARNTK